ncbi:hypothetical protein EGN72_06965 [Pseudorhodobacter sp. E13]|uniref:hypothetical protein n=1 Tax=Pseudorhodobacter sp. E13 TaxID=2487931 RepID=UPI000F8C53DE|nr:hypothetical protein [Pseudorhodobacter sp. E13]RUS60912.1 hypothetical protein EGN72_06965 [Pseudorhodobacter sp. E13]
MADPKPKAPAKLEYSKKTKRMDFEVNGKTQVIWVRQYWEYSYTTKGGATKWTSGEKKKFHQALEKVIRKAWNGKFVLTVTGKSEFATYFKGKTFDVMFDVNPKTSGAHWKVKAIKVPKGDFSVSSVNWNAMEMTLDTEDTVEVDKGAGGGAKQSGAAHEFGHAIGNTTKVKGGHGDEYSSSSAYKAHKKSIMHSGMQVKKRHADYLVSELNKLIPDTTFAVKSVK